MDASNLIQSVVEQLLYFVRLGFPCRRPINQHFWWGLVFLWSYASAPGGFPRLHCYVRNARNAAKWLGFLQDPTLTERRSFSTTLKLWFWLEASFEVLQHVTYTPFTYSAVNSAGPIYVGREKGQEGNKVWICWFMCCVTQPTHLELVLYVSTVFLEPYMYHCKNNLVVLSTEWLPWLQKSKRDSGYVLYILLFT